MVDNLDQVKRWLEKCLDEHWECDDWLASDHIPHERPTRLIEILLNGKGIRLQSDVRKIPDLRYLTLSHVWGKQSSNQASSSSNPPHARYD